MRSRIERLEREIALVACRRRRRRLPTRASPGAASGSDPRSRADPSSGASRGAAPRRASQTLEVRIGARWATWIGVVAIVTAIGLLLRWSFEKGLIGPAARVITGAVSGTGLLVAGLLLRRRRDPPVLAPGLAGGGLAILYLSVWAATRSTAFSTPRRRSAR